ncbi:MAG: OmpH family outer membrane protein [Janthinobacterium lividum]
MKNLHLTFAAALLIAGSFFAPSAQAQAPLKIGYTSVEYVLSQMPESKQIESDLKAYGTQLEAQIKSKQTEYQTKLEAYQKGQSTMTPVIKADKEKELTTLGQSIQEFGQSAQQSMQQKQQSLLRPVLDKIQKTIDAVAQENGYTYVLNSDSGSNPVLLHGPKDGDVSDVILKKMGITPTANAPAPSTQAPRAASTGVPAAPSKTKTKSK